MKYKKIWRAVKKELSDSAHGIHHTERVYHLCKKLSSEKVDEDVLLPAAILHDIARDQEDNDDSRKTDHAELGAEMSEKILMEIGFEQNKIEEIKHCIRTHRFRGNKKSETIEAKILSDADKLDAIGAVGVARMFMLAGQFEEHIYRFVDPELYAEKNMTQDGMVKKISDHSPNLEYELKLKKIPERLYTEKAKEIAKERLDHMESFFSRLEREIEGGK